MPTRDYAIASVRLYDEGQGDPVVADHGFDWLTILASDAGFGTFSRTSAGFPLLEMLPGIGLTCRPSVVLKDTRLSHFITAGGSFAERRPIAGSPRVYRLAQTNATAGIQYSAATIYHARANPHVAFTLLLPDTPPDWDATTYPPYVRIELAATVAIQFEKGAAFIARWVDGAWRAVESLPNPSKGGGYQDLDEIMIWVRCYRGRVGVSFDLGQSYTWHGNPDGSPLSIPAGAIILRGQGGQCAFGIHQLAYTAGTWTSPQRNTFTSRIAPTSTITGRADTPGTTSVSFTDLSSPTTGIAQWRSTLTPDTLANTPFAFHSAPVLYSVQFSYPVTTAMGFNAGTYTTWTEELEHVRVRLPYELGEGDAAIEVRLDPQSVFAANYRWRKVAIYLGFKLSDNTDELTLVFTGYVRKASVRWEEDFGRAVLVLECDNAAARFRRTQWTALSDRALGGEMLNGAADYILASEGLDSSYRSWNTLGNSFGLPSGAPEEPFERLQPREHKWDTLQRIFGYAGLELAVTAAGGLISGPFGYYSSTVWNLRATPQSATDDRELLDAIEHDLNYAELTTAVMVYSLDQYGSAHLAWAVDTAAETSVLSGRFCPWREVYQDEIPGRSSPGIGQARAAALAGDMLPLRTEGTAATPADLRIQRRDQLEFHGVGGVGIADNVRFVVLTQDFDWRRGEGGTTLVVPMGIRRIL